jgi:hypothetical protein
MLSSHNMALDEIDGMDGTEGAGVVVVGLRVVSAALTFSVAS